MTAEPHPGPDTARPLKTVLFVCTGNTCRSPMAQAIAEDMLRKSADAGEHFVASAGVAASSGGPATPEAVDALAALGVPIHDHRSTPLSATMVERAHAVYALTASHRDAILAIAPEARERIHLLDPEGHDVPDPIGMSSVVYLETARHLRTLVAARLRALGVRVDQEARA